MEEIRIRKTPNNGGLQASTLRRKQQRSGKRPAHQAGQRMQSQICLAPRTVCSCSLDPHPRGWVRRAGNTPPCAASFFPYSFFAGEERIWPPEGASPIAWKSLRRKNQQARKNPPSYNRSAQATAKRQAASTPGRTTDAVTSLPGTPYSVRLQPRPPPKGLVFRAGPPATRVASFFPDSFFAIEERIAPRRALALSPGRH